MTSLDDCPLALHSPDDSVLKNNKLNAIGVGEAPDTFNPIALLSRFRIFTVDVEDAEAIADSQFCSEM